MTNNEGKEIELLCPNCGNAVRATARFCPTCGFALAEASQPPKPVTDEPPVPKKEEKSQAPQPNIGVSIGGSVNAQQMAIGDNNLQIGTNTGSVTFSGGGPSDPSQPIDLGQVARSPEEHARLIRLHRILSQSFNESELKDLSFFLDIDYEELGGETKKDKSRQLIFYYQRRDKLSELISTGRQLRPDAFTEFDQE